MLELSLAPQFFCLRFGLTDLKIGHYNPGQVEARPYILDALGIQTPKPLCCCILLLAGLKPGAYTDSRYL